MPWEGKYVGKRQTVSEASSSYMSTRTVPSSLLEKGFPITWVIKFQCVQNARCGVPNISNVCFVGLILALSLALILLYSYSSLWEKKCLRHTTALWNYVIWVSVLFFSVSHLYVCLESRETQNNNKIVKTLGTEFLGTD